MADRSRHSVTVCRGAEEDTGHAGHVCFLMFRGDVPGVHCVFGRVSAACHADRLNPQMILRKHDRSVLPSKEQK